MTDDDIDDDFYEDDEDWDDAPAYEKILASMPEGWSLVRVISGWQHMVKMREWLQENATGEYREVNWATGPCSASVGVMLEKQVDIVLFKLRWGY